MREVPARFSPVMMPVRLNARIDRKIVVLVVVLALLRGADFYDRWVLFAVLALGAVGSALLDYRAVRGGRVPYVQP